MNIDNDYDNDGNNIVPCPICLDVYCPSKENGKCPEEDMFALEGEIRMLLYEYKATDDNSRIANVLEAVEKILHHQLQKARHDWRREEIVKLKKMEKSSYFPSHESTDHSLIAYNQALQTIIDRYQSELDQDKK